MNSSEIIIVWYSVRDNVPASELQAYVFSCKHQIITEIKLVARNIGVN